MFGDDGTVAPMRIRHDASIGPTGMLTVAEAAITTEKLADGAITTPKILAGSVTAAQLAAGAVTSDKLLLDHMLVQSAPGSAAAVCVRHCTP